MAASFDGVSTESVKRNEIRIGESLVSAHLGVAFNLKVRLRVGETLHSASLERGGAMGLTSTPTLE